MENITNTQQTAAAFFGYLPNEMTLKILSYLNRKDLFSFCLSCQWINAKAESSCLWKKEISLLNIEEKINIKKAIGEKITSLKKFAEKGDHVLHKTPKTGFEFDQMIFSIPRKMAEIERNIIMKQYRKEQDEKTLLSNIIQKAFFAIWTLRRLGLKEMTVLEKYAQVTMRYYGSGEERWLEIAYEYILDNDIDHALQIMNNQLKNSFKRSYVLKKVIESYVEQQLFNEAIEIMKPYFAVRDEQYFRWDDCCMTLLNYAEEYGNLAIVEFMIDTFLRKEDQFTQVKFLIAKHLDAREVSEAQRIFEKYAKIIASSKDYERHEAIFLYVGLGYYDLAWSMAVENKEEDDLILYVLRSAFSEAHLYEEESKVVKMLSK